MLLHSCPDTVHRFLLRKTQASTPLIEGCLAVKDPRISITPAVADCRYRAPLTPRLRGNVLTYPLAYLFYTPSYYNPNRGICQPNSFFYFPEIPNQKWCLYLQKQMISISIYCISVNSRILPLVSSSIMYSMPSYSI